MFNEIMFTLLAFFTIIFAICVTYILFVTARIISDMKKDIRDLRDREEEEEG